MTKREYYRKLDEKYEEPVYQPDETVINAIRELGLHVGFGATNGSYFVSTDEIHQEPDHGAIVIEPGKHKNSSHLFPEENGRWRILHWHYIPGPGPDDFEHTVHTFGAALKFIEEFYFDDRSE